MTSPLYSPDAVEGRTPLPRYVAGLDGGVSRSARGEPRRAARITRAALAGAALGVLACGVAVGTDSAMTTAAIVAAGLAIAARVMRAAGRC